VQLYESAGLLAISVMADSCLNRIERGNLIRGTAFCCYMFWYGLLRLSLDPLRADGRPERFWGFSYQQWIALALMCLSGLLVAQRRQGRTDAVV
jgi:prolipoprotein diacylglyceryltransferase